MKTLIAGLAILFSCADSHATVYSIVQPGLQSKGAISATGSIETTETGTFIGSGAILAFLNRSKFEAAMYDGEQLLIEVGNTNSAWAISCDNSATLCPGSLTVTASEMTLRFNSVLPFPPPPQYEALQLSNYRFSPTHVFAYSLIQGSFDYRLPGYTNNTVFSYDAVKETNVYTRNGSSFVFSAVGQIPEPSTWLLAAFGLVALALARVESANKRCFRCL